MTRRGCYPLRHGDVLLGFLWVIVGDEPLTDAERRALVRGAREAAENLWGRLREADEREQRIQSLLRALLAGDAVAGELAGALRWPASYAIAVVSGDVTEGLRRRRRPADFVAIPGVVLARDPDQLASDLAAAGARAGVSAPFTALAQARSALRQAQIAALVPGTVTAYDRLGSWGLVAQLWDDAGRPAPPPCLLDLAAHRRGEELLEALEGLLEAGGDVAAAAKALHVHRATLYRRLERVEEITGWDLERGDDRLLAHLGLRLYRLASRA